MTDCNRCGMHSEHSFRLDNIENNISTIIGEQKAINDRVIVIEENTKQLTSKIESQEELVKSVFELAFQVQSYGAKLETVIEQQGEILSLLTAHEDRLTTLEHQPADKLFKSVENVKATWISALIGGISAIGVAYATGKLNL